MISVQQFQMRQPELIDTVPAVEDWYRGLADHLVKRAGEKHLLAAWPEEAVERAAMGVACYLMDIVSDAGVWRGFQEECKKLNGKLLPFYPTGEDYIEAELNEADIRFLIWYTLAMNVEDMRTFNPMDADIAEAARVWFGELDARYEDAPEAEWWTEIARIDLKDPDDRIKVARLSNWLFMYCYLTVPAYALTMSEMMEAPEFQSGDIKKIQARMEQSMAEDPTGPLALYLGEWVKLILNQTASTGKSVSSDKSELSDKSDSPEHPYYTKFMKAVGRPIAFFDSYEAMNTFFQEALGWNKDEEHLPQVKGRHDYVLYVDPVKGMLLAADIARCIAHPENPLYDKEYAREHAIELLTERGCCPADLLHYIGKNGLLPDAVFPGSTDTELVAENFDFIARCYLQLYYRGD